MKDAVEDRIKESSLGSGFGVRHVITLALCLCLTANYILRVNLSVAVVVMTDIGRNDSYPVFDWSPEQKGMLLSSFFIGYLVSNLVASVIVTRYSCSNILLWSVMYSTVISLFTPMLVTWGGYTVMFIIRVSMGLVQGFMMPATHGILSKWIPVSERSRCGSIVLGGLHLGTIASFVTSGLLSSSPWGWPSVFYFSAFVAGLWCLAWWRYSADSPDKSKYVSAAEKIHLKSAIVELNGTKALKRVIPWKMIFTNKAVYALAITMIGQNWGFWILITLIPSYFYHVFHLDISQNGALAAMPFISLWLTCFPVSFTSDYLISRNILSLNVARKMFNTLGQCGAGTALLCLAFTTSKTLAVTFYTVGVTLLSFTYVGFNLNPLDIAPNYAGLLMGLTNGIATTTAIAGPAFVGFMVKPLDNVQGWKIVFLVASGMLFAANLAFVTCGSANEQDFNNYKESEPETDTERAEKEPLKT